MVRSMIEYVRIAMFFAVVFIALIFSVNFSNWGNAFSEKNSYLLHASFEEIGSLRIGAPVKMAGVLVGKVNKISLNKDYQAEVMMRIQKKVSVPVDSSVRVVTQGIIGGNYLSLTPGVSDQNMRPYANIERSHSAFIMENFINKAISELSSKGN